MTAIEIVDGEEIKRIMVVGEVSDHAAIVKAHGYDPAAVEWSVQDPDADLHGAIENASNLQELKSALTNSDHPAKSRGRGR